MELVEKLIPMFWFLLLYSCISLLCVNFLKTPVHLSKQKKKDYQGQHISLLHSVLSMVLAVLVYFSESGIHYNDETNFYHVMVLAHSLGYFVYDMIYAEIFQLHDWAMRVHHVCVILGGFTLLPQTHGGSAVSSNLLLSLHSDNRILQPAHAFAPNSESKQT